MKKNLLSLIIAVALLNINAVGAQVQNNGLLHISDNASFYVASGSFTFGTGSTTTTTRTVSTNGKLILNSDVTVSGAGSGAGSGAALFADGFISTKSSTYIPLPTGQTTTYAPIGITNAAVTNGVEAAYYIAAPTTVGGNLFPTVSALQSAGYWEVKGDNATITMIWSSSISSLTNSISDLTVAGYNSSTSKWEAIASATPSGDLTSGTIATAAAVTLTNYSAFTLARKGIASCAELVASTGTKTWTLSGWSPSGNPTLYDAVTLEAAYPSTEGSFVCNSLAIGTHNITLTGDQTIEVVNGISGTGTITMSSESSILQRNDNSTITPPINLTKSTRTGLFALDYIYWGSPLTADSYSLLANARAYNTDNTEPRGDSGAFDLIYKYVSGDTSTSGGWQTFSTTAKGVGFIMRIKNQAPFTSIINSLDHINLTFSGTVNNGPVVVDVKNITTNLTSAKNNNLLANPYPSAIDADKFLEYNTNLDGVVYIWKAQTFNSGVEGASYNESDYIAYTLAGSTGTAVFNGKIATGQGFKVKAITSTGTGTATFNNCMRVSGLGSNSQFFRTMNTSTVDRYKLNLAGANGVGNQILIAYIPGTTLGYDRMYDAQLNSVSAAQLFSTTQNDSRKLAINARPTFEPTDVVNLGVSKSNANSENFTIAITDKEGIFAGTAVNVFLYDNLLNVYHNLANGAYTFNSNTTALNNRFQIVYQDSALNNVDFETTTVFATIANETMKITASLPMTNVTVYDISGRLIKEFKVNNETSSSSSFVFADGIYIAKIKLNNGKIATQKLVNKK